MPLPCQLFASTCHAIHMRHAAERAMHARGARALPSPFIFSLAIFSDDIATAAAFCAIFLLDTLFSLRR